ncbi:hypothetical protein M0802_001900 [Mischocyttarus mexicanus]|nr:hypothetical protein M0802_001900 [Mischocyttarus mexicanus]
MVLVDNNDDGSGCSSSSSNVGGKTTTRDETALGKWLTLKRGYLGYVPKNVTVAAVTTTTTTTYFQVHFYVM